MQSLDICFACGPWWLWSSWSSLHSASFLEMLWQAVAAATLISCLVRVCLCFVFSNCLDHLVWFTCEQTLWSFLLWTFYQRTTVILLFYDTRFDESHCLHTICGVKFNNEFFFFCNCTFYLLHWKWMMKEWTTPDPGPANAALRSYLFC